MKLLVKLFCLSGVILAVGGLSTPLPQIQSEESLNVAVSTFGHVSLPYVGEGHVYYDTQNEAWVVGFPASPDKCRCNWLGYEFRGPAADTFGVNPDFRVEGSVAVYEENGEVYVDATDGKNSILLVMTFGMVPAAPPPLSGGEDADDECNVQNCPGGCCSCTGPQGPAKACCPSGFRPSCRCTQSVSSGVCTKVVVDKEEALEVENITVVPE